MPANHPNHPNHRFKGSARASGTYYSTSQTAQLLGLSVGTVQRMVESGALQAYTTQGGHRRILASAVRHYCQQHGVPGAHVPPAGAGVCVVHPANAPLSPAEAWTQLPQLHEVSHPLDLAGVGDSSAVFFIDARVPWLDWPDGQRPAGLATHAPFVVYHSEVLTPEQHRAVAQQAQLLAGDISPELVQGYLLALSASERSAPAYPARSAPSSTIGLAGP
jgi:excisionase family DNA binding protein